jgi:uncharacterized repeat protein (TIGR01451 family)
MRSARGVRWGAAARHRGIGRGLVFAAALIAAFALPLVLSAGAGASDGVTINSFSYDSSDSSGQTLILSATYNGGSSMGLAGLELVLDAGYTVSAVSVTGGASTPGECTPDPVHANEVSCSFNTGDIPPGTTFTIMFKTTPNYPTGQTNGWSASDYSNANYSGQVMGPTTGTTTTTPTGSTPTTTTPTGTTPTTTTTSSVTACQPVQLTLIKEPEIEMSYGVENGRFWSTLKGGVVGSGEPMRYDITVTNVGKCPATNVNILDSLPASFRFTQKGARAVPPRVGYGVTVTPNPNGGGGVSLDIPALAPGAMVDLLVEGTVSGPGPLDNTAAATADELSQPKPSNAVNLTVWPTPTVSSATASTTGVNGTATPGRIPPSARDATAASAHTTSPLVAVYIAVRKLGNGCTWLNSTRAQFQHRKPAAGGPCLTPIWLKAHGTSHWRLRFKKPLRRGRYELLVKAVNRARVYDTTFSPGRHNLLSFRVG